MPEIGNLGFSGDLVLKNPPVSAGDTDDTGSLPGSGRSLEGGNCYTLNYSCWEKSQGHRNLAGFSSWGCKELDTTERACTPNLRQHANYQRIDIITSN